jgi:hypothetical protein
MSRSRIALLAALWLCLVGPAAAQQIHYVTLTKDVIEQRLRAYKDKNQDREAELKELFTEAGCPAERLSEQPVKGEKIPNVLCTLPGSIDSVIIVGAHFDHVSAGKGVIDNWSGASMLPSLLQSLKDDPRRHTFVFIGFTDEETGLNGSEFYAGHLSKEERLKVRAMVNLDSLALSPTKVWVSHSDKGLVEALGRTAAAMKLPVAGVNADQVGDEDSHSFARIKVPTLMLHSVTQETLSVLHSNDDDWKSVKLDDYYDSYRLITAYLAFIDLTLDKEKGAGSSPAPAPK